MGQNSVQINSLEISQSFRIGIEDIMSWCDEKRMPAQFHEGLLNQTNTLLATLEQSD